MARVIRNGSHPSGGGRGGLSFLLPIFAAVVVLVLVAKAFFGSSTGNTDSNKGDFVTVTPGSENSEIYIYMSGDSKKQITAESKMFTTDNKLEVKSGDANITLSDDASKITADKLAEISYAGITEGKKNFTVSNSYAWIEAATGNLVFNLKNFSATPDAGAVFALYQNAVGSNIYVLKGTVNVKSPASSTSVGLGQMLTILASEASTAKLPEKITPIDDFFKTTDLFVKHNGSTYLSASSSGETLSSSSGSTTTLSGATTSSTTGEKAILFTYPEDEMTVNTSTIDVEGKIGANVTKITLNDKAAELNKTNQSFSFKGFALPSEENNIVYRAYDENGIVLAKWVLTVHSSSKKSTSTDKPTVTTYPVSDKDFKIIAPTENPYKTSEDVVKIQGQLTKGAVKYITINGYRLSKFSQYASSWYYFANKDFGTLNEGINLYEIKYYGETDNLLSTGLFTIVKEAVKTETSSTDSTTTEKSSTGSGSKTSAKSDTQS